jgi:DNA-binding CsgD family transcriptional regulator
MPDLYGTRILTGRERELARHVADGKTNKEIGRAIGRTEMRAKNMLRVIYDKLGVWNRLELALWYVAREREAALKH